MHKRNLEVGKFYTNVSGLFARQLLGGGGITVTYRDFALSDGHPISPLSHCTEAAFARWATRECTSEEQARCDFNGADRKRQDEQDLFRSLCDAAVAIEYIRPILEAIRTDWIIGYLQSKGYTIHKEERQRDLER